MAPASWTSSSGRIHRPKVGTCARGDEPRSRSDSTRGGYQACLRSCAGFTSEIPQEQVSDPGDAGDDTDCGEQQNRALAPEPFALQPDRLFDTGSRRPDLLLDELPLRAERRNDLPLPVVDLPERLENLLVGILTHTLHSRLANMRIRVRRLTDPASRRRISRASRISLSPAPAPP